MQHAIFTIGRSWWTDCLLVRSILHGVLLLLFLYHGMAGDACLGRQRSAGPMFAALIFGNWQQTCLGRMAGQIGRRQCQHGRASGTALNLAVLAVTMLLATLMGGGGKVNE